jgi:predicted CXXCH cytochrome family protein
MMLGLLAALLAAPAVWGQTGGSTVACVSCHEEPALWTAKRNVHAPVEGEECLACHNPHASRHGGLIRRNVERVCLECHDDLSERARGDGAHGAIASERSCLSCHDPHASDREALLLDTLSALCAECHEETVSSLQENAHPHVPASRGQCLACHDPHGAEGAALAREEEPALCTGCHQIGTQKIRTAHKGIGIGSSTCTSCHAPHGSALEKLVRLNTHAPFEEGSCEVCHEDPRQPASELRSGSRDLCEACHEPREDGHPITSGEACVSCHTPHTSSGVAMIAGSEKVVCLACHEDIATRQAAAEETHPAIERGQHCSICHELHTGQGRFHLTKSDQLALCTTCHSSHAEFAHPMGRGTLDRSRRGRYVDCLSCHDPHGTTYPRMLVADQQRDLCIRCHTTGMSGGAP